MDNEDFLLAEYQHFSESFWRNEERGEKIVNFFITITTAIISGIIILVTNEQEIFPQSKIKVIVIAALFATLMLGLVTFIRIIKRNHVTDEYKHIIEYLRDQFIVNASSNQEKYKLPFDDSSQKPGFWCLGGLAITVAVTNSILFTAIIVILWFSDRSAWGTATCLFLFTFIPQVFITVAARNGMKGNSMNNPEPKYTLQLHPRPKETVSLEIPTDTLESLKKVAASRDMSVEALLKFYIGQELRQDLAKFSSR